jgi:hypothetical protein
MQFHLPPSGRTDKESYLGGISRMVLEKSRADFGLWQPLIPRISVKQRMILIVDGEHRSTGSHCADYCEVVNENPCLQPETLIAQCFADIVDEFPKEGELSI